MPTDKCGPDYSFINIIITHKRCKPDCGW